MMDDDERWGEQMLQRVRAASGPSRDDAARNLAGIEARLGLSNGASPDRPASAAGRVIRDASAGPSSTARAGAAAGWKVMAIKAGLVLSFGLATGVFGYLLGRSEGEQQRPPVVLDTPLPASLSAASSMTSPLNSAPESPTPATNASASIGAARAEAGAGVAQRARPRGSRRVSAPPSPRAHLDSKAKARRDVPRAADAATPWLWARSPAGSSAELAEMELGEAVELLRRAEAALRRGDGLEARTWLSDLDRRAPRHLLLEERLVTRTLASCALGDTAQALASLRELEQSNPESIYRARLEGSCVASP